MRKVGAERLKALPQVACVAMVYLGFGSSASGSRDCLWATKATGPPAYVYAWWISWHFALLEALSYIDVLQTDSDKPKIKPLTWNGFPEFSGLEGRSSIRYSAVLSRHMSLRRGSGWTPLVTTLYRMHSRKLTFPTRPHMDPRTWTTAAKWNWKDGNR